MSDFDEWSYTPNSSTIERFAYDDLSQVLTVVFKSGARYLYADVDSDIYDAMVQVAEKENEGTEASVGKFLAKSIKGVYEFRRVEP